MIPRVYLPFRAKCVQYLERAEKLKTYVNGKKKKAVAADGGGGKSGGGKNGKKGDKKDGSKDSGEWEDSNLP